MQKKISGANFYFKNCYKVIKKSMPNAIFMTDIIDEKVKNHKQLKGDLETLTGIERFSPFIIHGVD